MIGTPAEPLGNRLRIGYDGWPLTYAPARKEHAMSVTVKLLGALGALAIPFAASARAGESLPRYQFQPGQELKSVMNSK